MSTLPTPRTDAVLKLIAGCAYQTAEMRILARQLERELAEAKAERDALKDALAFGQENCDAEYNRLRDERDEMTKVAQGACRAEGEALKREDRWRSLAEELAEALETCSSGGGTPNCGYDDSMSFDEDKVKHALARFRDAANPASARTPPGINVRSGDE